MKNKEKKEADALARENTKSRDTFIEKAKKELNCEVVEVKVANGTEPVLTYKNHRFCWCAPRAKLLWTAYEFKNGSKEIVKIKTKADEEKVFDWLKSRCKEIDLLPSVKANDKKPRKSTTKKSKQSKKKLTPEEHIAKMLERMEKCTSKAISYPKGVIGNEEWFKTLIEEQGWKLDSENRTIFNANGE